MWELVVDSLLAFKFPHLKSPADLRDPSPPLEHFLNELLRLLAMEVAIGGTAVISHAKPTPQTPPAPPDVFPQSSRQEVPFPSRFLCPESGLED